MALIDLTHIEYLNISYGLCITSSAHRTYPMNESRVNQQVWEGKILPYTSVSTTP